MLTIRFIDCAPGAYHTKFGPSSFCLLYEVLSHGDHDYTVFADEVVWC